MVIVLVGLSGRVVIALVGLSGRVVIVLVGLSGRVVIALVGLSGRVVIVLVGLCELVSTKPQESRMQLQRVSRVLGTDIHCITV